MHLIIKHLIKTKCVIGQSVVLKVKIPGMTKMQHKYTYKNWIDSKIKKVCSSLGNKAEIVNVV